MRFELLVALLFVVPLHIVNGFANERPQRAEHPFAFGASPAVKIVSLDPYQFATHRLHSHLEIWRGYASLKGVAALAFDGTATTKAAIVIVLGWVVPKSPLFEHTSKPK
jgi:hypothetical protein